MKNPPKDCLQREVFTISRELEYFTADELEKQTGYGREEWWPGVIGKETIDNALDACEQAEVSPEITVQFQGHKLDIRDNGGGIPPETVERQVDYSSRTSDKLGYVSPTRGAQGNAWKTILAMPYVLDGERARPIIIEARGVRHQIHVRADQIQRRPRIDYRRREIPVKTCGTAIFLERDQACLEEGDENFTVREAAYGGMRNAYLKASSGGTPPAHARQVMYAARPDILRITGRETLDDDYFTRLLLPEYMREHPEETGGWDVVYDDRGHLIEPHTGKQIGIGTLSARQYLSEAEKSPELPSTALPELSFRVSTTGPRHRYGGILFIEKEGFFPLLERVRIAERYDLALMSTKGMGSTSARQLIERLAGEARIFVLHDFDKSGFSIVGILGRDTTRYQFRRPPEIIDMGLRLEDIEEYTLQNETVD